MKTKFTVHVHCIQYSWEQKGEFQLYSVQLPDSEYRSYVCSQEVEIEMPEDYDATAQKITALEEQKSKLKSEFVDAVIEIDDKIGKLQAIEYTAE